MSLDLEKARAKEQGDVLVGAKFNGAVRNVDASGLEKGDTFTFPTDYEVYKTKFPGGGTAEYIWITTETGEVKRFFPSTFTKARTVAEEDGTLTRNRLSTSGTVTADVRKCATINEAMEALKGKKVVVTDIVEVRCLRYGTKEVITDRLPQIDYAA